MLAIDSGTPCNSSVQVRKSESVTKLAGDLSSLACRNPTEVRTCWLSCLTASAWQWQTVQAKCSQGIRNI